MSSIGVGQFWLPLLLASILVEFSSEFTSDVSTIGKALIIVSDLTVELSVTLSKNLAEVGLVGKRVSENANELFGVEITGGDIGIMTLLELHLVWLRSAGLPRTANTINAMATEKAVIERRHNKIGQVG